MLTVVAALAAPAAAHANAFDKIFHDYQRTGKIDPCKYSRGDLQQAQSQVPNDVEAYAPDFPNALQAALEARAGGGCHTGSSVTPAPVVPPTAVTTTPAPPAVPGA